MIVLILFLAPALLALNAFAEDSAYFDWEEFNSLRRLDPDMQEARLCGLDKICIRLWEKGEMLVKEHGMVSRADFNGDGSQDISLALEKDRAKGQGKDYFILLAAKTQSSGYKWLQTVPVKNAPNIIETFWDDKHQQLMVDIGKRQSITIHSVESTGTYVVNSSIEGAVAQILYTRIFWNPAAGKFEIKEDKGSISPEPKEDKG